MTGPGTRVLITGGSGFIGTNCVEYFRARGAQVLNVDVQPPRNSMHQVEWKQCDILERNNLCSVVRAFDPHYVLHLAARTDLLETAAIRGYAANHEGTRNIIDACSQLRHLRRAIFASSRMVCRIGYVPQHETDYCPPNLYGESKVRAEGIIRESRPGFEWMIVRPTSIWGPWFDVPYKLFFDAIANHTYWHPRGHDPQKSFGFVGNTVFQYEKLLLARRELVHGVTMYQCDYPPIKLRAWAELAAHYMDTGPVRDIPLWFLRVAAAAGDLLTKIGASRVPLTTFRLNNLLTPMVFDTSALQAACGALPYSLQEGVIMTVRWMRAG